MRQRWLMFMHFLAAIITVARYSARAGRAFKDMMASTTDEPQQLMWNICNRKLT